MNSLANEFLDNRKIAIQGEVAAGIGPKRTKTKMFKRYGQCDVLNQYVVTSLVITVMDCFIYEPLPLNAYDHITTIQIIIIIS